MKTNGSEDSRSWSELAIGLYDQLTGRGAEISYEMRDLEVCVPSGTGAGSEQARWKLNGTVKIRTRDIGDSR